MEQLDIHSAALVMPPMPDDEFQDLKSDIEKNGLLCPIVLLDGKIIDGRHRYLATVALGIDLTDDRIVEVDLEGMTPEEYVWSLNGTRRHLTESQRAACFHELIGEKLEKESLARKVEGNRRGGESKLVATLPPTSEDEPKLLGSVLPPVERMKSRDEIARAAGVSPRTVQDAATVSKKDPELFARIKSGEVSASKAARQVRQALRDEESDDAPKLVRPPDYDRVSAVWHTVDPQYRLGCLRRIWDTLSTMERTCVGVWCEEPEDPWCEDQEDPQDLM